MKADPSLKTVRNSKTIRKIQNASRAVIETLESRRLLSTTPGLPDTTYNTTGVNTLTSIPNFYYGAYLAVATQTDGKSVAVGFVVQNGSTTGSDILLARYNTDGTLDTTFGSAHTGYVITDIGSQNQSSANLKIQADGKIIVLTSSNQLVQNLANSWIVRYNANGTLDTGFGGSNTGYIASTSTYSAVALQGDGTILAAGSVANQTTGVADAFVKKYTAAGTLVTSFGTGGTATEEVGTDSTTDDAFIYSIVQDNNGNILLGGTRGDLTINGNPSTDGLVIRFTSAGALDTSFGSGKGFVSANANSEDFFQTVVLLPDNGILLAGNSNVATTSRNVAILEFDSTGKVTHTFQPSVYGTTTAGSETNNNTAILLPNGDIVGASGVFGSIADSQSFIYRLTSTGALDSSFGSGGKYDIATNQSIVAEGTSLQPDGSLIVAGAQLSTQNGTYYPVIARYNGDAAGTTNGSISGNVFNDANSDGTKGSGETNLAGVDVYIDANGNGACDANELETVTDANGNYSFGNLAPDSYLVRAEPPTGYTQTVPAANGSVTVVVAASKTTAAGEIGFTNAVVSNASIAGEAYDDTNDNGSLDGGEQPLDGVTITLTNASNVSTTQLTNATGKYSFTGLAAGVYTVAESAPSGFTVTQPTTTKYTVTLTASQSLTSENFGNYQAPVAPTVTINQASGQADPTSASPVLFSVVFSASVTGFDASDVALPGTAGATTAVVSGSGANYTVAVSGMTKSGTVVATIPAAAAKDGNNTSSAASTSTDNTVTYNLPVAVAPTVTINQDPLQADPTSLTPIVFDVVFSAPVTGFDASDVALSGTAGATTAVVSGSGANYTVNVSGMTSSGTVIATIPPDVAEDASSTGNAASTSTDNTVTYTMPVAVSPTVAISDVSLKEGNSGTTPFVFTVTRSGDSSQAFTVDYATADGTATTADNDYVAKSGTLTFNAGVNTQTITVLVNGDTKYEADETFTVNLSNFTLLAQPAAKTAAVKPAIAANPITKATGTGTIINDDAEPTISINNVSMNEGNSGTTAFVFTVTRAGDASVPFTVDYATADGTATVADNDYQATSGTLTFAAGDKTHTITVLVNGDTKVEADETFTVNLKNLVYTQGGEVGQIYTATGTGTIVNDDTVVAAPTVSINDVSMKEGNSGTTAFVFTVTRSGDSSQGFEVDYATADGTATVADNDYQATSGTLTFAPGTNTQTITVLVNGDTKVEADETFTVNLSNFRNVAFTAIPAAVKSNVVVNPITKGTGTGTIVNDDSAAVPPTLDIEGDSHAEGDSGTTAYTFTVTRSGDTTGTSSVNYATADGTATVADNDYQATSGTLNFAAGQTTATITVLVNGDTAVEPNETFTVNLSSPINATITSASATGRIVNDDVGGVLPTLSVSDVTMKEGNSGQTVFAFIVTRTGNIGGLASFDFATADGTAKAGSDYEATSGTAGFSPDQKTQEIDVIVNGDTTVEPNETFFLNITNATEATIADGQGVGTIVNDDSAVVSPTLAINNVTKKEGNSGKTAFTFTVTRSGDTSSTSSVSYATADGTATSPSDYTAATGTVNFAKGQKTATITVYVNGDTTVEADEKFFVNLTNATGATIKTAQGVGTITNDDTAKPPVTYHSQPYIIIDNPRVKEGNNGLTAMTFTITLTHTSKREVKVQYKTTNGPLGDSVHDYVATSGTVVFKPGQKTATVTVYIKGNLFVEPNETFYLDLFNPTNAGIGDSRGTGTIVNDDFAK